VFGLIRYVVLAVLVALGKTSIVLVDLVRSLLASRSLSLHARALGTNAGVGNQLVAMGSQSTTLTLGLDV
jgi:hypothetical protein